MIDIQQIDGKNIYTISIEGRLNQQDIEEFYSLLEEKLKENLRLQVLITFKEFPGLKDFATLGKVVKMKAKALQGFGKYAVLTDKSWVEIMMPMADFITPGTPVKAFHLDEKEKAIAWLEDKRDKVKARDEILL